MEEQVLISSPSSLTNAGSSVCENLLRHLQLREPAHAKHTAAQCNRVGGDTTQAHAQAEAYALAHVY